MINKYKELHERLMEQLLNYHNQYTSWVLKQSQEKTKNLRNILSEMRRLETEMRAVAQQLMREETKRKREKWNKNKETHK